MGVITKIRGDHPKPKEGGQKPAVTETCLSEKVSKCVIRAGRLTSEETGSVRQSCLERERTLVLVLLLGVLRNQSQVLTH